MSEARANPGDSADGSPQSVVVISPERILTITDGVVAIAMTLLVLDLHVDYSGNSPNGLWRAITAQHGRFIAFFIAFWVVAQFWLVHHRIFRRIIRYEDTLAARNFWFLFGVSVVPFTTSLLGQTTDNPLAVTLFSANLLLINLALTSVSSGAERLAAAERLPDERQVLLVRARRIVTAALLVVPGGLAWVIRPGTAELVFLLLFVADVPGRLILRRRERRVAEAPAGVG